jgi:glycine/D-amino acid oxidase-like deaminating enzyme
MIRLNRAAQAFAREAVEDYGVSPDFFDPVGKINGAATERGEKANAGLAQHLAQLNEPFERLDAAQMTEVTGITYYRSGLFTSGTVMLQPAGYVRGLAKGLARDGAKVFERSAVTAFRRVGRDWNLHTANGTLTAPKVILATNGHLESFGFSRGRLMQLFLFAVMTPELNKDQQKALGGLPRWGITPADPMGTTLRRIDAGQGGHRLVVRACARLRSGCEANQNDLARAERAMRQRFDRRFGALAGLGMAYSWAGHLCLARNGVSVAREVDAGVFSACVQNGLGTARGTLTGIAAAEGSMGLTSETTEFFAKQAAPNRLPPSPFRDWGANAYLSFAEWASRNE